MCFFGKKAVGLDIADRSIEVAEVTASFGVTKVKKTGRIELEQGIVERGRIIDPIKLASALSTIFKSSKPKGIKTNKICFALPESQVYLRHVKISNLDKKSRVELIKKELIENLPITESDLAFSYRVLSKNKTEENILATACSRKVLQEWSDFFRKNKLGLEFFDIEILAVYRDLFDKETTSSVCVVDIGSRTSMVSVFEGRGLVFEFLINKAGGHLTDALVSDAEITTEKAEEEKIKNGLKGRSKKVTSVLEKEVKEIVLEIKESLVDYSKKSAKKVEQVILVGGTSQMLGLSEFFEKELNIPVKVGSSKALNNKIPLFYVEAIGLALRGLDNRWDEVNPVFYNNY